MIIIYVTSLLVSYSQPIILAIFFSKKKKQRLFSNWIYQVLLARFTSYLFLCFSQVSKHKPIGKWVFQILIFCLCFLSNQTGKCKKQLISWGNLVSDLSYGFCFVHFLHFDSSRDLERDKAVCSVAIFRILLMLWTYEARERLGLIYASLILFSFLPLFGYYKCILFCPKEKK